MRPKIVLLTSFGFILATLLFVSLSLFTLVAPLLYHHSHVSVNLNEFTYIITISYFTGMPLGKIIGRVFGMHRHLALSTFLMAVIISISIPITYISSNFYELIFLRVIQGTSTFLMEIFSIEYSKLLKLPERIVPSTISIGGIPTGVALGTFFVNYISMSNLIILVSLILIVGGSFSLLINSLREYKNLSDEYKNAKSTNYRNPATWLMGIVWMSIAGFNLSLAVILPLYLLKTDPPLINNTMNVFGIAGALFTFLGGVASYLIYKLGKKDESLFLIPVFTYLITAVGFLFIIFAGTKYLLLSTLLVMVEAMNIGIIYSIPKEIFGEKNYANATWEFSLIGSSGHIIAPLILIPIAFSLGFNYVFLVYAIFPLIAALSFLRIKSFMCKRNNYARY